MFKEILIYLSVYIGLFAVSYYLLSFLTYRKKYKKISENKLPKVAVIIPAYNEEKGIKETIMSALNLDYPKNKLEIVVVDNGSKDKTYSIAKKIKNKKLKVLKERKKGKANALNFAISKVRAEIIVTMDADTSAERDALKKMVHRFSNPKVMCVAPSIIIHKPKGVLQRVQQIEYFLGLYLRKAFNSMNAIHITPGAFSAYRKSFFKKYGGFDVNNITEDMEMCFRIQYNNLIVECEENAITYTKAPNTFLGLLRQRRRWYFGLTKNLWSYRKLFSKKYGQLGLIVLPMAVIAVLFAMVLTSYLAILSLLDLKKELMLISSINFDFSNFFTFNKYIFERFFFILFSNPVILFLILFMVILGGYMLFAKSKVKRYSNVKASLIFFLMFYSLLFAFWWFVSLFYVIFVRKVSWGAQ